MKWLCVPALVTLVACGADPSASFDDPFVEELEADDVTAMEQELSPVNLPVTVIERDVASGAIGGKVAVVLKDVRAATLLLGDSRPSIDYSRHWLLAYRPEGKTPTSRVVLTRAQLSATGQTLSIWATVTEPGAGCAPWLPTELALGRVPKRTVAPTTLRLYVTRTTSACGLVQGDVCTPGAATCPAATPLCHGGYQRPDESMAPGRCTKLPRYDGTSGTCANDAACGADGICAGLSMGPSGLCQAAWMRGTYSMPEGGQFSAPLPQGGEWYRTIVTVRGQATVPIDAWVQVFTTGLTASRVEWRVTNPMGTTSAPVRGSTLGVRVPVGVPGDESINGEWVVEVRDTGRGARGTYQGVRLSFTSRWD